MPPKKSTKPSTRDSLDEATPRTIEQMAPNVALFRAEPGGRPRDEIDVPFALARATDDGKGERLPDPADDIEPPAGVLKEG